jgi:hypothetical protein
MVLLLSMIAWGDIAPSRVPPCAPRETCFGLVQDRCDLARERERCDALRADGWAHRCTAQGRLALYCRAASPGPVLPDPPADVAAALADGGALRARLAGPVEARVLAGEPPLALGPYAAEGSEPLPVVVAGAAHRIVVGVDVALLATVDAGALVPVITAATAVVPPDGAGAGVVLRPGARVARLAREGGGVRVRALGPVEVEGVVPASAVGLVFEPSPAGVAGDRCAAVGAILRADGGAAIGRIVGEGPCVPGFSLVEARGDRALVALVTDEIEVRGWLSESELTLPIPGLRGFGAIGGGGSGGGWPPPTRRPIAPETYLYDEPGGAVVGRADSGLSVLAVEAREDGWWLAAPVVAGAQVRVWVPPDGATWPTSRPPRAAYALRGAAAPAASAAPVAGALVSGASEAVAEPSSSTLVRAAAPAGGCGCASARAPLTAALVGLALVAARRRRWPRSRIASTGAASRTSAMGPPGG